MLEFASEPIWVWFFMSWQVLKYWCSFFYRYRPVYIACFLWVLAYFIFQILDPFHLCFTSCEYTHGILLLPFLCCRFLFTFHFLFLILCPFFLVSLGGCLLIFIDLFKEPVFGFSHFHNFWLTILQLLCLLL